MPRVNQSTLKALDVLELLADSDDGMRLTDLGARSEYPLSTVRRLLVSLIERGYVEQDRESNRYYLGAKILTLQAQGIRRRHIGRRAFPYLLQLRRELDETVNLGILSERSVIYLETLVPDSSLSFYAPPGTRMPLHCTAMGKVLLAHSPAAAREALLAAVDLKPLTPRSITSLEPLRAELNAIIQRGYAIDNEEYALGVRCVAAPVHDHSNRAVAGVSVTMLASRFPPERDREIARAVTQTCAEISHALGWPSASFVRG